MSIKNVVDTASFITDHGIILFTSHGCNDMVGEPLNWIDAKLITDDGMSDVSYEQLKDIYKTFHYSMRSRMDFWGWIKSMSPKTQSNSKILTSKKRI